MVYPVGVTTYWCYFSCIIAHNSLPVYDIPAKVGTEMRLYTPPSVCQISRQSDNAFAFYSSFCKCAKRGRKIRRKKTKKLSQFLKSHISGIPEAISLKFGMWSAEGGGNLHSKICLVSSRQHRATEVRKLRFLSSCQYTHGVARRLLGPHDTLPCVLILKSVDSIY